MKVGIVGAGMIVHDFLTFARLFEFLPKMGKLFLAHCNKEQR